MDPARNNQPLQFNKNKNKPPIPVTRTNGEMKDYDNMPSSTTHSMMGNNGGNGEESDHCGNNMLGMCNMGNMMGPMVSTMGGNPNMMMMFGNMPGGQVQGPMMGPGQMGGPSGMLGPAAVPQNMLGPGPQGMMGPGPQGLIGPGPQGLMGPAPQGMMDPNGPGMIGPLQATKEVINLTSCILYPPPANAQPRSTREKPPGCKTIFVGGLPENCTEDILTEVFEKCGPVLRVRISRKNFSHIRFENMESVEEALYISGYRMKINDSDTKEDTGRLHIDYAEARDDQFDFECMQRAMAREMRHYHRLEEERNRPPSPEPICRYAEHEAVTLLEKLRLDEEFMKASQVLITWLERGECNRRTFNTFYSLVQNVHSQLRRASNELQNMDVEFEQYKIQHQQRIQGMIGQICQVERVLASAHKQRNWDHFTKPQRKNIITWQRQAQELRETQEKETIKDENVGINDDMDFSDDDVDQSVLITSSAKKRKGVGDAEPDNEVGNLQEENDHLKCQMEAFKNEVDCVRQEGLEAVEEKDKQIKSLQNALQGMQQQLIAQRASMSSVTQEKDELEKKLKSLGESNPAEEPVPVSDKPSTSQCGKEEVAVTSSGSTLSDKEVKMIGLASCFLHVHPSGATVDYLWSYLSQLMTVRVREVEDLLEKMPSIFEQKIVGLGATIERRWTFTALKEGQRS